MKSWANNIKWRVINRLTSYLLCSVNANDIITHEKGKLFIGGKEVEETELRSLIAEAKVFDSLRIWTIFQETIRNEAMDKGFNKSTSFEDLKTCKTMLYELDILASIVKIIRSKEKK